MDDVLAENEELRPTKAEEGEEPSKEDQLADEVAQLKDQTAAKVKELQVQNLSGNSTFGTYLMIINLK